VVVILPVLNHQIEFDRVAWLIWLQMALWTFSTMIPFEIRDISNDSESMKTIPQVFGVRGAKMIGSMMLFGVVILSIFLSLQYHDIIPTLIACTLALICLWKSNVHQSTYYASFWVEALPMVWLLMVVFWKWI
jgi:4-hydroxybenzoate polyprenyltransferase